MRDVIYFENIGDIIVCDKELGWKLKPNFAGELVANRNKCFVTTNSAGLRGKREYGIEKPKDKKRILLLGDSFANGLNVDDNESVDYVLENYLKQSGLSAEVINSAVVGYGTDQEYLFLVKEGLKYSPDLVVMFFYENDWHDNNHDLTPQQWGCPKPYFVLDGGNLTYNPRAEIKADRTGILRTSFLFRANSFFARYFTHSIFMDKLKERIQSIRPFQDVLVALHLRKEDKTIVRDLKIYHKSFQWEQYWPLTERLVEETAKAAKDSGAGFLLVQVPANALYDKSVLWNTLYPMHQEKELENGNFDFERIDREWKRMSGEIGINYLNLAPSFKESNKKLTFYPRDQHWNPIGHELAGTTVGKYILEKIYVK